MTMGAIKSSPHLLIYLWVPFLSVSVPHTSSAHWQLVPCTVWSDGHAWPSNSQRRSAEDEIHLTSVSL